ncbi:hypothetical protein HIM_03595 [Hirsutella minnesotensis 3608]|uniref:Uncharacterized protein n=1 Tax=Hirsutella minnesotensis 3608 TaxID=1043627 RepID=A0A0F8A6L2_9HYPO|nr:hypothetical protein HIM_03595 [Hirsutella minnesotensis 3608]
MANPNDSTRRFAPIPIETTFQSIRKTAQQPPPVCVGPQPELTPEPSPRSASPAIPEPQQRNGRFHPQLIETSRRSRRAGDPGPATRPTDKTDITPYTNHIYAAKPRHRRRRGDASDDEPIRHMPPTRRETEDEGVKEYLLELAAKEAARQIEEAALAAFPNSRAREGGVAHFYYRESSGSDNSAEDAQHHHGQSRARRKSSNLGLNWWHKHMQEHAEHLTENRHGASPRVDEDTPMTTDSDLDDMDLAIPPNPLWTTASRTAPEHRRGSLTDLQSMKDSLTPLAQFNRPIDGSPATAQLLSVPGGAKSEGPSGQGPFSAVHHGRRAGDAELGRPFGAFGLQPEDPKLHLMRQAASPPMLGKDLKFRKCPSPKQTKLETDHPFYGQNGTRARNQNAPGQLGLWNSERCGSVSNGACDTSANGHPAMIATPQPPGSPCEPLASDALRQEPSPIFQTSGSSDWPGVMWGSGPNGQTQAANRLCDVDERLRREKAKAERNEKIMQEFDDEFVTQVYNYLSLGYPAMARSFDEELSRISRVTIEELGHNDDGRMAKGHMLEMKIEETSEGDRCPRWKALRAYIREWAEQHPNLDNLDPLAWGVRERRGSWAI